jgi:hypothetical protein
VRRFSEEKLCTDALRAGAAAATGTTFGYMNR